MNINEQIEDSEESGSSMIDPQARIDTKAKKQYREALKAATNRVANSSVSSSRNKNYYGQDFGRSHYASQEESEIFSFMDSILSEKMIEILEADLPSLKGKTEVVCGKTGIDLSDYAGAQGITSK